MPQNVVNIDVYGYINTLDIFSFLSPPPLSLKNFYIILLPVWEPLIQDNQETLN